MSKKKQRAKPAEPKQLSSRPTDPERVGTLARNALNPKSGVDPDEIEAQLSELNPEEAAMFLRILTITLKRRRIQMLGYICALIAVVGGLVLSMWVWGNRKPGEFVGWVFILPPGAAALCIWLFGRWSNRIK